jgi:hypothetical protein
MALSSDDGIGPFTLRLRHSRPQAVGLLAIAKVPDGKERIRDRGEEDYQKDRIAASTFASCCLQRHSMCSIGMSGLRGPLYPVAGKGESAPYRALRYWRGGRKRCRRIHTEKSKLPQNQFTRTERMIAKTPEYSTRCSAVIRGLRVDEQFRQFEVFRVIERNDSYRDLERIMRPKSASLAFLLFASSLASAQNRQPNRPFGTLREQAALQQSWLEKRLKTVLPGLMRKHGVDMWVIPMREYNEDPTFSSLVSPTTFAARRRTIYVFFDKCAASGRTDPGDGTCVERIALGGTSQGGLYEAVRSTRAVEAAVGGRQAELWGDAQWQVLKDVIVQRQPKVIGINVSRTFAFTDGMSAGELEGMSEALGATWTSKFKRAEELPLEFIAARIPEEEVFYRRLQTLVWQLIGRMYSSEVI